MRLAHRKGLIRVHTYQHTVSFNCRLGIWTPIKIPARTCFFFSLPLQPPASSLDSETRPPVSTAPPLKDKKKAPKNVCTFTEKSFSVQGDFSVSESGLYDPTDSSKTSTTATDAARRPTSMIIILSLVSVLASSVPTPSPCHRCCACPHLPCTCNSDAL